MVLTAPDILCDVHDLGVHAQGDHGCHVGADQVLHSLPGQLLLHLCAHPAPLHLCVLTLPHSISVQLAYPDANLQNGTCSLLLC